MMLSGQKNLPFQLLQLDMPMTNSANTKNTPVPRNKRPSSATAKQVEPPVLKEQEAHYGSSASQQSANKPENSYVTRDSLKHFATKTQVAQTDGQVSANTGDISRITGSVKEMTQEQRLTNEQVAMMKGQMDFMKEQLEKLATKDQLQTLQEQMGKLASKDQLQNTKEQVLSVKELFEKHEQRTNARFDKQDQAMKDLQTTMHKWFMGLTGMIITLVIGQVVLQIFA